MPHKETAFLFRFTFLSRSKSMPTNFFPTSSLARCERRRKITENFFSSQFLSADGCQKTCMNFLFCGEHVKIKIIDSKVKRNHDELTQQSLPILFEEKTRKGVDWPTFWMHRKKTKKHKVHDKQWMRLEKCVELSWNEIEDFFSHQTYERPWKSIH